MKRYANSVYCAGPLFTEKEREEMNQLASALEEAGFGTFLPQRDGLELTTCSNGLVAMGADSGVATSLVSKAIFALDVYQVVIVCDAIAVNLNGRVPDEGAVSEAALAWCANKIVVGYKADHRSVFMGHDNPLVAGLFDFNVCNSIPEMVAALQEDFKRHKTRSQRKIYHREQIKDYLEFGAEIWDALCKRQGMENVAEILFGPLSKYGN